MTILQVQEILRRCYDPSTGALRINENSAVASYTAEEEQAIMNKIFDEETNTLRVIL